jgi:hypothetical protein
MIRIRSLVRLCSGFSSACWTEGRAAFSFLAISAFDMPDLIRNRLASAESSRSQMSFCFDMGLILKKLGRKPTFFLNHARVFDTK